MNLFSKIEPVTRNVSISHFLLLFGYKLFALYFPLFLAQRGLSLPQVGSIYLFIYLPYALSTLIVGVLSYRINPVFLVAMGTAGYGMYALGVILIGNPAVFFGVQILLGVSAALFFAGSKIILMGSAIENPDKSFGWFHAAPFYADAAAPALGALLIWQFGFFGVFLASIAIHLFNVVFIISRLKKVSPRFSNAPSQRILANFKNVGRRMGASDIFPLLLIAFLFYAMTGFYLAFFVLFLKELGWTQEKILLLGAVFSLGFLPVSLLVIRQLSRQLSSTTILQAGMISAIASFLFGLAGLYPIAVIFLGALLFLIIRSIGMMMMEAGSSALIMRKFPNYPIEAGTLGSAFAPLGVALGAFLSGILVDFVGFPMLFIGGGIALISVMIGAMHLTKNTKEHIKENST